MPDQKSIDELVLSMDGILSFVRGLSGFLFHPHRNARKLPWSRGRRTRAFSRKVTQRLLARIFLRRKHICSWIHLPPIISRIFTDYDHIKQHSINRSTLYTNANGNQKSWERVLVVTKFDRGHSNIMRRVVSWSRRFLVTIRSLHLLHAGIRPSSTKQPPHRPWSRRRQLHEKATNDRVNGRVMQYGWPEEEMHRVATT